MKFLSPCWLSFLIPAARPNYYCWQKTNQNVTEKQNNLINHTRTEFRSWEPEERSYSSWRTDPVKLVPWELNCCQKSGHCWRHVVQAASAVPAVPVRRASVHSAADVAAPTSPHPSPVPPRCSCLALSVTSTRNYAVCFCFVTCPAAGRQTCNLPVVGSDVTISKFRFSIDLDF